MWSRIFPPINGRILLRHYLPMSGVVCHSLYAVQSLNRSFFVEYGCYYPRCLLGGASIGIFAYVYFRKHISKLDILSRISYSGFLTFLLLSGTFTICKSMKSNSSGYDKWAKLAGSIFSSIMLIVVGKSYLDDAEQK